MERCDQLVLERFDSQTEVEIGDIEAFCIVLCWKILETNCYSRSSRPQSEMATVEEFCSNDE